MNKGLNELHALEIHGEFFQYKSRQIDENRKLSRRIDDLENQLHELNIRISARDALLSTLLENK